MGTYALINSASGAVENTFLWDGSEESGWYPPEGCIAVQTDVAGIGWAYINGVFVQPPPPEVPPPTPAEILASQITKLQGLKQVAEAQKGSLSTRIAILNESIEYEMATPEEVIELPMRVQQREEWGQYAVLLGRVTSQTGWPSEVSWPVQPTDGIGQSATEVVPPNI